MEKVSYEIPDVKLTKNRSRRKAVKMRQRLLVIEEAEARELLRDIEEMEIRRFYDTYTLLSADLKGSAIACICESGSVEPL